jgi:SAM-dependent methyltransferase
MSATLPVPGPLARAAAVQALSVPVACALTPAGVPWPAVAAVLAVALVPVARLGPWWLAINAVFLPALSAALALNVSPLWALAALAALMLFYGQLWKTRVPLFFSSSRALEALPALLPVGRRIAFLDVGCGDGRVLAALAAARPESRFDGIEHALIPWLFARLRLWNRKAQCNVARGDFWARSLDSYDVVYAFLSPAVMERLWKKAQCEMRPGTLLVSAFEVPGVMPDRSLDVNDAMETRLHVWRMGSERVSS